MKKIRKITLFILIILLMNSLLSSCYATSVTVTKEKLNASMQKFAASSINENNYKITVSDSTIKISGSSKSYSLNYSLAGKPKFKDQTDYLMLPLIGYIAVADIQGVQLNDITSYLMKSYLRSSLLALFSGSNSYVIIDDINVSDGVTIEKDRSNPKNIYASEFGNRVMEYVNDTYKNKQTMNDAYEGGISSYELIIERKEITNTSCKLVSTLTVDPNANFSKLIGDSEKTEEALLNKDITRENADYLITLKVGQKCKIETTEKITGYELAGTGFEYNGIDDNCAEITGKSVGKANGYIYVGETKKSIYIIIEENKENTALETISIKINATSGTDKSSEGNTQPQASTSTKPTTKKVDTTISNSARLPQTGLKSIVGIVAFLIGSAVIYSIKLRKYKDIK